MRGHLPWNDSLFRDAPALWDGRVTMVCKRA